MFTVTNISINFHFIDGELEAEWLVAAGFPQLTKAFQEVRLFVCLFVFVFFFLFLLSMLFLCYALAVCCFNLVNFKFVSCAVQSFSHCVDKVCRGQNGMLLRIKKKKKKTKFEIGIAIRTDVKAFRKYAQIFRHLWSRALIINFS